MCIKEDKRNLILIFDCWLSILSIFQNSIFQLFCSWHLIFTNNSRGECGIRTNFNLPGDGGGGNSSLSVLYRNIQMIIHFTPPLDCLPSVSVECLCYLIEQQRTINCSERHAVSNCSLLPLPFPDERSAIASAADLADWTVTKGAK